MARASDPARAKQAATWIVRRLRDSGHIAYFNGGCVRDGLLGLHPTDYDVATDATPQRVKAVFQRTAEVGAAFGVVLVQVRPEDLGQPKGDRSLSVTVEVATFRSDGPYSDARRPDQVHFADPRSDAQRRDFTINALFLDPLELPDEATRSLGTADPQGRVIDYVGGVEDLKRRVVRAVGDPDKRLAEDHLRALRAVRFAARLGFTLDPATAQAITRHASELRGVSKERIGEELRRMLAHPSRAVALRLLQQLGLDAPVLGDSLPGAEPHLVGRLPGNATAVAGLAAWALDRHVARTGQSPWLADTETRLLVRGWRTALCLSNEESEALEESLNLTWAISQRWGSMRVSERKRTAAKILFSSSLEIVSAADPTLAGQVLADLKALSGDGIGIDPSPLVTGDDLVASGMKPGPQFKRILDEVRDAQLEGRIGSKPEGMELARRLNV